MYLGYQNGKIKFYTEEELSGELYLIDKSEYTDDEYVLDGDEYVLNDAKHQEKQIKQRRIEEIMQELDALDLKTIRPLRAGETSKLEELEVQACALRQELHELK